MAENITVLSDVIFEKTTPKITAVLEDEDGTPIPDTDLGTLTLTQFSLNDSSNSIINSREDQDVLNTNDVTVDASGNLTWQMQEGDTTVVDTVLSVEDHRAVFAWTYDSGNKTGRYIIDMTIRNLKKVS